MGLDEVVGIGVHLGDGEDKIIVVNANDTHSDFMVGVVLLSLLLSLLSSPDSKREQLLIFVPGTKGTNSVPGLTSPFLKLMTCP